MFRQSILKSTINCQITPSPQRQQRTYSSAKQIRRSGGCGYSRYQQSAPPLCARCSSWWAPCQTGHFPPAPPRNQCDSRTPLIDTERNRQRQAIRPTSFYIIKLNEITFFVQREQFFFFFFLLTPWRDVPKFLKTVLERSLDFSLLLTILKCLFDRLDTGDDLCQVSEGGVWTSHHLKERPNGCSNLS